MRRHHLSHHQYQYSYITSVSSPITFIPIPYISNSSITKEIFPPLKEVFTLAVQLFEHPILDVI